MKMKLAKCSETSTAMQLAPVVPAEQQRWQVLRTSRPMELFIIKGLTCAWQTLAQHLATSAVMPALSCEWCMMRLRKFRR